MQSLLRWSIENSTPLDSQPSDRPPARREDLNPEIIDMILGKPDAELMKEDVDIAVDSTKPEAERLNALDHLEMLIEQIDNANNLGALKLWEPLQSILTSEASKEIKVAALWVIGTALQNNPSAQDVYLEIKPLPTLFSFLEPTKDSTLSERSKVIYTLSGFLKHNTPALRELSPADWQRLKGALQDPEIAVRRKTIFLLNALLVPTSPVPRPSAPSTPAAPPAAPALPAAAVAPSQPYAPSAPFALTFRPADPTRQAPVSTVASFEGPAQPTNLLTPDDRPQGADPIHPNSHAAHQRDTSRSQTSSIMLEAAQKHGIVDAVLESLVNPLPYGVDGENVEGDADYEGKAASFLRIYTVLCHGSLNSEKKATLKAWLAQQEARAGPSQLAELWGITVSELVAFASL